MSQGFHQPSEAQTCQTSHVPPALRIIHASAVDAGSKLYSIGLMFSCQRRPESPPEGNGVQVGNGEGRNAPHFTPQLVRGALRGVVGRIDEELIRHRGRPRKGRRFGIRRPAEDLPVRIRTTSRSVSTWMTSSTSLDTNQLWRAGSGEDLRKRLGGLPGSIG